MDASVITVPQFCAKYSIDRHTVYDLIRRKKLQSFKFGKRELRVVDPGPEGLAGIGRPDPRKIMFDTPVFRACEAAQILGVHKSRVGQLVEVGKIHFTEVNGERLFSLQDILERMRVMAGEVTPKNPQSIRPWLVIWGRKILDKRMEELREAPALDGLEIDVYPSLQAIRELAETIAELPLSEEEREREWQAQSALLIKKVRIKRKLNT